MTSNMNTLKRTNKIETLTSRLRQLFLRDKWMGTVRQIRQHSLTHEGARDIIDGDKWSIDGEGGEVVCRSAKLCLSCTSMPGNSSGGLN